MAIYMKYGEEIKGDATQNGLRGLDQPEQLRLGPGAALCSGPGGARAQNREAAQAQIRRCHVTKDVDHSSGADLGNGRNAFQKRKMHDRVCAHRKSRRCLLDVHTHRCADQPIWMSTRGSRKGQPKRSRSTSPNSRSSARRSPKTIPRKNRCVITYSTATGVGG